ncbi:tetratricopeptide repeat protein [Thiorhodococcus minor]|uniref:Tetratricopeptide repeat protein n=1 Tax=Thiorhodococcus minor TaxID=57489 RepID=A0A6M0JYZ5_9GAMM|nr:tetratricopeptide repeat protein [Thiorhodococcus minor]NEV62682.1 tetratricopeptide repeat protein [Thiorhodococcus minor]
MGNPLGRIALYRSVIFGCLLMLASGPAQADALSALAAVWQDQLRPVVEGDISGAEPLMQKAIRQARDEVAALLAQGPEGADAKALADAYGRLGVLLLLLEVENPADAALRNAAQLQPEAFHWPYYSGYMAMLSGNTDLALQDLRRAQALDPDYRPLDVYLGRVLLDLSELGEARALLEPVAEIPGLAAAADYYLGQIALLERRYTDAVARLTRALALDPKALGTHYPLAQAYRALGEDALARSHLAQFEMIIPAPQDPRIAEMKRVARRSIPAFERGLEEVRQGDYAEAARLFAEGLKVAPNNAAARISFARALYLSGEPEAAEPELKLAVELDPDEPLGHLLLGVLALSRADRDAARSLLRQALKTDPRQAGALYYLAGLDFDAEQWASAAERYEAALAIEPELAPAGWLRLIARFRAAGASAEAVAAALDDLSALYGSAPQGPQAAYALGCLLAAGPDPGQRDPDRALRVAEEGMRTRPGPQWQRVRALALAGAGRYDEALAQLREMLSAALWGAPPAIIDLIEEDLAALEREALPDPWPLADPMLSPPPVDPTAVIRDYPAVNPY